MTITDWQSWQMLLQIARCGSLNKAAESLNLSQPTLSRQLQLLEMRLGQSLFDRSTQGMTLTHFGESLIESCEKMEQIAQGIERQVSGQDQSLTGRVRLSVNELVAQYYLPEILPAFMAQNPELSVEVVASNQATSLDKRDADVAIRMFAPQQQDLVARRLGEVSLGFFASKAYLDQYGVPDCPEALLKHRLLGYDRDKQLEQGSAQLGWPLKNEDFLLRTDFQPLHLELARYDGGILISHKTLAARFELLALDVGLTLPALPVYLCCHRDVQHNRRIRLLMDFLAEHLTLTD
ncbi:LysR family transcriptional regulator [Oceanospirillum sanctuarii]|uniref:LysR family transcriptional regulator n=1 Tax=Oceanospirillum sanctuarii TaxID=1434821 RepID=UPI000A3B9C67|nr:LysR family transcriptional regulator [Oceanospirillum sanctuarii]